jgi:calcineurin-like phosphoesterase family protein
MVSTARPPAARAALACAALVIAAVTGTCGGGGNTSTGPTPPVTTTIPGDPFPPPTTTIPISGSQIFVGAGDIAMCDALEPARLTGRLLAPIGGTVFTLGDNAYFGGTAQEFSNCYDTTWGSERYRTRPVTGNHEYAAGNNAVPYFNYFGGAAGVPPGGYYSFELGSNWHAIALNSNILPMSESSLQGQWLKNDLAINRTKCTIAYWHHPLFTSAQNGPQVFTRDFWRMLYAAGADIVLVGHDHVYERFAPQDPDGRLDPARGIRQFLVGTGGALLYNFVTVAPNSEARIRSFGVLKLTLDSESYQWQFIQTNGAVADSGVGQCH